MTNLRTPAVPSALRIAALVAGLALAACGYTTHGMISEDHKTIAVPVFDNDTRRHDLEWELTRAVVEEIHTRTHLQVVDPSSNPDLVLKGKLVEVDEIVLSRRGRQRIRESAILVTAEIEVEQRGSKEPFVSKRRITERESFTPLQREDVRTAREEAVRTLAERIVQQLEGGW